MRSALSAWTGQSSLTSRWSPSSFIAAKWPPNRPPRRFSRSRRCCRRAEHAEKISNSSMISPGRTDRSKERLGAFRASFSSQPLDAGPQSCGESCQRQHQTSDRDGRDQSTDDVGPHRADRTQHRDRGISVLPPEGIREGQLAYQLGRFDGGRPEPVHPLGGDEITQDVDQTAQIRRPGPASEPLTGRRTSRRPRTVSPPPRVLSGRSRA